MRRTRSTSASRRRRARRARSRTFRFSRPRSTDSTVTGQSLAPRGLRRGRAQPHRSARNRPRHSLRLRARHRAAGDVSPRINGRYDIVHEFPRTTVKGGRRALLSAAAVPGDRAASSASPSLVSNRAIHYSLGVEQEITRHIEVSVEGFYKNLDNLVARGPNDRAASTTTTPARATCSGPRFCSSTSPTRASSAGSPTRCRARPASARRTTTTQLFQYDQTHILTRARQLPPGRRLGVRRALPAGLRIARHAVRRGHLQRRRGRLRWRERRTLLERLPMFHQLDLRVDKQWRFSDWTLRTYLDVQNVYNRVQSRGPHVQLQLLAITRAEFLADHSQPRRAGRVLSALLAFMRARANWRSAPSRTAACAEARASTLRGDQGLRMLAVQKDQPYPNPADGEPQAALLGRQSERGSPATSTFSSFLSRASTLPGDLYYSCFKDLLTGGGILPTPSRDSGLRLWFAADRRRTRSRRGGFGRGRSGNLASEWRPRPSTLRPSRRIGRPRCNALRRRDSALRSRSRKDFTFTVPLRDSRGKSQVIHDGQQPGDQFRYGLVYIFFSACAGHGVLTAPRCQTVSR